MTPAKQCEIGELLYGTLVNQADAGFTRFNPLVSLLDSWDAAHPPGDC